MAGTLGAVYPFSFQSAAQMDDNYFSVCSLPLASHQLFRDRCNPLLFMIVWDFWIKIEHNLLNKGESWEVSERNEMQTERVKMEEPEHQWWRSDAPCSWITLILLTPTKYTICFKLATGGANANSLDAAGDFRRLLEGTGIIILYNYIIRLNKEVNFYSHLK